MLGLASSSSRISSHLSSSLTFIRTKKTNKGSHFPKQPTARSLSPRIPLIKSPHDPRTPNPNAGASQPHPLEYQPFVPKTTSVALEDSHLRLHHSPPSSAPSNTTGTVPMFLQWLGGSSPQLTGEERGRRRVSRQPKKEMPEGVTAPRDWSDETKAQVVAWRAEGMSQGAIVKRLGLPTYQKRAVARLVPESEQAKERRAAAETMRIDNIGYSRRVKLEIRKRRKEFW